MSKVQSVTVPDSDDGLRLDRWFRRRYPDLTHGRLEKLLRTGQVRVDGARVKASHRIAPGQVIRVPPLKAVQVTAEAFWCDEIPILHSEESRGPAAQFITQ